MILGFASWLRVEWWQAMSFFSMYPEFGDKYFHINSDKGSRF